MSITDEMIFDLFEKIQVPIELEEVNINIFKNKIIDAITIVSSIYVLCFL